MERKKVIILSTLLNSLPFLVSAGNLPITVVLPSDLASALNNLFNFIFGFLLAIGVLFIMLAAYQMVTAGGDTAKIENARNQILWGVVGLLLAGLAKALAWAVATLLGRSA